MSKRQEGGVVFHYLRKKSRQNTNVDWLELPSELLIQIAENLRSVDDYVAFSCVCRCWRNAISGCNMNKLRYNWAHHQMPWLLLTDGNNEVMLGGSLAQRPHIAWDNDEEIFHYEYLLLNDEEEVMVDNGKSYERSILNLKNGKTYNVNCPQGYRRICWGSSHGWIYAHDKTPNMKVFNPLTNTRLDLPSKTTLPLTLELINNHLTRVSIFKVPSDDVPRAGAGAGAGGDPTLLVVLIYGYPSSIIVFAKPGDTEWTKIDTTSVQVLLDVSYCGDQVGGRLVVLGELGNLGYCDLERHHQQQQQQCQPLRLTWYDCKLDLLKQFFDEGYFDYNTYLVHCGEDILFVLRIFEGKEETTIAVDYVFDDYWTSTFRVYKFLFDDKQWKELQDLGDVALFVGSNTTISVCASDVGCQPNCIYYTDDAEHLYSLTKDRLGGRDTGIFRMTDKSNLPLDLKNNTHTSSYYCCPLWFTPTL